MSDSLFTQVDSLLTWLPNETLFSLCSRLHRLWGYGQSARSTEIMFGGPRVGTQHDLPSGLDEFALRTDGQLGTADRIARDRTLIRFYRPFLALTEIDHAVLTMRGPDVTHLKFRLGLLTSRFRANHPLKACEDCMRADLVDHGWVYWRLEHQFPGVWICPVHGVPLRISLVKSTGVERFLWSLPSLAELVSPWSEDDATQTSSLSRLSTLTIALIGIGAADGWLSADKVQVTLRARIQERGWLTESGNIRLTVAAADYLQHCAPLRLPAELSGLPSTLEEAKTQIGRLIRPLRSGVHPIRVLVAIDWLFDGADDFLKLLATSTARGVESFPVGDELSSDKVNVDPTRRHQLIAMLNSGASFSAAAREFGIDVSTVMVWAASEGIEVRRRPKILKAEVRASLVRNLRKGMGKKDAAGRHGISIETVTRLLHTEVGLHAAWKSARSAAAQRSARSAWLRALRKHPGLGVKLLRGMESANYAWLYRNDRAWLTEHTPEKSGIPTSSRQSPLRWDERDQRLCVEIEKAVERLSYESDGRPLKLWQIYQVVPELKAKLRSLDRMPMTRITIERALQRRRVRVAKDLLQQGANAD